MASVTGGTVERGSYPRELKLPEGLSRVLADGAVAGDDTEVFRRGLKMGALASSVARRHHAGPRCCAGA